MAHIVTFKASELSPGDEFWGDKPFKYSESGGNEEDAEFGEYMYFKVLYEPVESTNLNLFKDGETCVVIAVEYPDGSRGSRLYLPDEDITIRRPS